MISPTNGRIVWYTPPRTPAMFTPSMVQIDPTKPLAATVVHVWDDRTVNLAVLDSVGMMHSRTNITLLQDDDLKPEDGDFCSWMPYQVGQAKRHEAEAKSA